MEGGAPPWLDANFLAAALQGGPDKEPKASIVDFKISFSTSFEGFSSDIFRVKISYRMGSSTEEKLRSIVVKVPDTTGLEYNVVGPMICEKEFLCYTDLLPKMMKKVNVNFAPAAFYSIIDKVVLMEDLGVEYCLADKHDQLDFEHCKAVVSTLAKFHASSVALYSENTELIKFVGKEGFFPEGGPLKRWVELGTKTLGEALGKIEGYKKEADFLLNRVDNIWATLVDCLKPHPGRLNVLNHGDPWTNNIFFKYNESKEVMEVKLIDYQLPRYTLPTTDLVYFMYSSAQHEVREHRQSELYSHYLEVLNSTLEQLGRSERLTADQFKEDMKIVTPWFIGVTVFAIALIFSASTKDEQNFIGFTADYITSGKANPTILRVVQGEVLNSRIPHMVRQYISFLES